MKPKNLKRAMKLSVNRNRLTDNREQYPIEYLFKPTLGSGYVDNLDLIKSSILMMYDYHPNRQDCTPKDLKNIKKLMKNEEIVDIVLVSLFQWFGTNVGRNNIGTLLDDVRKMKYDEQIIPGVPHYCNKCYTTKLDSTYPYKLCPACRKENYIEE